MLPIIVTGAAGRMGREIIASIVESGKCQLFGATERAGCEQMGQDAGIVAGVEATGVVLVNSLKTLLEGHPKLSKMTRGPVIIDFTSPESTLLHLQYAIKYRLPMVIGTTGFTPAQSEEVRKAGKKIPLVASPNMSVGVNTLFRLVELTSKILGADYDVEVIEAHHRLKKDSPSGTAVRIAEILAKTLKRDYPSDFNFHRYGMIGERPKKEIGLQVIRGGDIVGDHTVMYCGQGERVEVKHIATSRKTFADGSLRAAQWVSQKKYGCYDMMDVLGLKD